MKKHIFIRFLIFFILFAGAIEAKPVEDKNTDEDYLPAFFGRTKIKIHDKFGLNSYFYVKPFYKNHPDLMFGYSMGIEFRF